MSLFYKRKLSVAIHGSQDTSVTPENGNQNKIKRSISLPIKKTKTKPKNDITLSIKRNKHDFEFFTVKFDYIPKDLDESNDDNKKEEYQHLKVVRNELVQFISLQKDGLCLVKSISSIGMGLVPFHYLVPTEQVKDICSDEVKLEKAKSQIAPLPPTTPSTINSKSFYLASISRSVSKSIPIPLTTDADIYLNSIESCEILKIEIVNNRLLYTIFLRDVMKKKFITKRYYESFYNLLSKIIKYSKGEVSLPSLPIPFSCRNDMPSQYIPTDERLPAMNNFLADLVSSIKESSSPHLHQILHLWLLKDEIDLVNSVTIDIKVVHGTKSYEFKCNENDIDRLEKLKEVVKLKINKLSDNYKLKAKLDGWYIVHLSDEDTYRSVFGRTWQSKELDLEIL
ncbi:hypothetical protein Kpol_1013p81 [Vanderwaltozyma polyspora DSM 70294]|uniref:PX domain-containing protein n=1 Tax=Vanderwaltozyma polyspora (strain ATCC 22028 / DSM 70294 / BCRC 21397 / CBS 2163 / NBRC 10782 / NRRL Y-8283 / UCD 57-17) TaxID=436907 RepID=A7THC5_VANPO|nr:uncharacterized protein Kpol_1013p81 [Vanderwaltozyma polyspora DSM 70294]EDO18406.1 hypothetical protein Kpol_1013p81 [Vanderwaltozyma polyspora DSM 70294]